MQKLNKVTTHTTWLPATWLHFPTYQCTQGKWTAVVSPQHGRLVALLHHDSNRNLLHFAPHHTTRKSTFGIPHWGAHAVWLGPQDRWIWPPSRNWELSPASPTSIRRTLDSIQFTLESPESDRPSITRTYRWHPKQGLECTITWQQTDASWFAIQIFAVRADTLVQVEAQPTTTNSTVFFGPDNMGISGLLIPHERGGTLKWHHHKSKIGMAPTTIRTSNSEGHGITISPDSQALTASEIPDLGHMTQIYTSPDYKDESYFELEQLSPIHINEGGLCQSTVYLQPVQ
ncbi:MULTISPECIES: hypothetical protein [unclassified Lentimonas]|uniref:hypothetical protein n=1 Tax=unclassified Lentimonas TaxID=2630993 RepID=UPI00132AE0A8|nr:MULTISPECIES: hypothetical protein [unclassified Lentimonas]CAA6680178.1 Unannotated [Lentimonas sp. CC4]CAA6687406.1 Unannotated [Lentimonas sp. CC6]CAA7076060.1 Unannotated [Lentimonas sp. CC4]CAA7171981.1 Unannotated [Lentimonas sp. CC21]CAA7181111.1 Unannotated [Lentimonas sp. CC8]